MVSSSPLKPLAVAQSLPDSASVASGPTDAPLDQVAALPPQDIEPASAVQELAALTTPSDRQSMTRLQFTARCAEIDSIPWTGDTREWGRRSQAFAALEDELVNSPDLVSTLIDQIMNGFEFTEAETGTLIKFSLRDFLYGEMDGEQKRRCVEAYLEYPRGSRLRQEFVEGMLLDVSWLMPGDSSGEPADKIVIDTLYRFSRIGDSRIRRSALDVLFDRQCVKDVLLRCFNEESDRTIKITDIVDGVFVIAHEDRAIELKRIEDGRAVIHEDNLISEQVMQVDGTVYMRIPVPGNPNIHICYDPRDVDPRQKDPYDFQWATGDLSRYSLFLTEGDAVRECDPSELTINFFGNKSPGFVRISGDPDIDVLSEDHQLNVDWLAPPDLVDRALHCYHERLNFKSEIGEEVALDVYHPNRSSRIWSDHSRLQSGSLIAELRKLGIHSVLLRMLNPGDLLEAAAHFPFQALVQADGNVAIKILPVFFNAVEADAGGYYYVHKWRRLSIIKTTIHERMGHWTHLGGEDVLFPLMILDMMNAGYQPGSPYSKKNLRELWSVAHEDYFVRQKAVEAGFLPAPDEPFPESVGNLLGAVYTEDGKRFDPTAIEKPEDLGFSVSVG